MIKKPTEMDFKDKSVRQRLRYLLPMCCSLMLMRVS